MLIVSLMLVMVLMVVPAFADSWHIGGTENITNQGGEGGAGGKGGNATIEEGAIKNVNNNKVKIDNTDVNVNVNRPVNINKNVIEEGAVKNYNTNKQNQKQGQSQGQGQNQNNDQVIAPSQEINIEAPKQVAVGSAPNMVDTELNFISPNERDVQSLLPKFGCGVVLPLQNSDCIVDVIWQTNDIKFKDLYKVVLKGLRSDKVQKLNTKTVRYQIREAASTKTWTTGGEIAGNAVGIIGTTVAGAAGGVFPKVGRSKSSNLYTVVLVRVQDFKN